MGQLAPLARRALVIDDGPLNLRLTKGLLEKHGCIVDTAASGEEAVAKCKASTYDAIFVDLHMPGMDGRATIARLRESEEARGAPRTPVVLLTADDVPPPDDGWYDLFMSKPVTAEILAASLQLLPYGTDLHPTVFADADPDEADVVDAFLKKTSDAVGAMKQAFHRGDLEEIVATAHDVKGTAAQFGFRALRDLASALELGAKAGTTEEVARCLDEMGRSLSLT